MEKKLSSATSTLRWLVVVLLLVLALSNTAANAAKHPKDGKNSKSGIPPGAKWGPKGAIKKAVEFTRQWTAEHNTTDGFENALARFMDKLTVEAENGKVSTSGATIQQQSGSCGTWNCPSGQRRTQRIRASSNGCGSSWFNVPEFRFNSCCNAHDICYGTCNGTSRQTCDDRFYTCMWNTCPWWDVLCKNLANTYYAAVRGFGCSSYGPSQRNNCGCVRSSGH